MYVSPRGEKGTIEYGELTRIGPTQETGGQSIGIRLKLTFKSNMHRVITQKQVSQLIDRVI